MGTADQPITSTPLDLEMGDALHSSFVKLVLVMQTVVGTTALITRSEFRESR